MTFDTTYKTNRYDMPFGFFIGVNHHGMSTLLGAHYYKMRRFVHSNGFFGLG
ncbi:hypothetical protein AHAS_Ahas15G0154200 [Arachis hypogaea]